MKENDADKVYYLKVKKYNTKRPISKRVYDYSLLNDYDKMKDLIIEIILDMIKEKDLNGRFPLLILNHPEIKEILIYSKEQWELYYKYNLIKDCISNKTLKVEYLLYEANEKEQMHTIPKIRENKKIVIKYIIKNLPLNLLSYIFITFLKERNDVLKDYEKYLINEITTKNINIMDNNLNNDNIEENININSIINESQKEESAKKTYVLDKDYFIHKNDFLNLLDERFKKFSENQQSFDIIKNLVKEDEEIIKEESSSEKGNYFNSSMELRNDKSLKNISLFADELDTNNNNKILLTVLNPPHEYVKNLMSEQNFFKKFNNKEYYVGIEEYKDEINRKTYEFLTNNKTSNF